MEKRIKPFSGIDDIIKAPKKARNYMDSLRTEIYYMQKKLRKQKKIISSYRKALESPVEAISHCCSTHPPHNP